MSPAHDGTSLYLNFRALAALLLWAAYFSPQHHAGANECGTFAPVLFLFALHPESCRSHCSVRLKRASAHSRSIANWFSISGYAASRGNHPAPRPVWLGATGQGLEWSAGADDRLNAGIGPAANSNNNVRGDMPFDEPFGERLQRSSQLAVVLLGPRAVERQHDTFLRRLKRERCRTQ